MLDVVCTTVNGGIPIFYRKKSSSDPIPFSTLSTLNAIVTFAEVQNVLFQNIHTDKHVFIWHNIDNRLIIAGISNLNDSIVTSCLELISNLIKIMVGEENLSIKNNDRLKREIKPCIPVIDYLLSILKSKTIDKSLLSHLEVQSLKENKVIHNCLYNWSEIICSDLCWIIVDKKICAATNDWWNLHITERKLLSLIILSNCYELNTSADIPIFLPRLYQKSLLRLVCCMIVQGVWIAAICGPNPSLDNIEISAAKSFRSVISHFRPNYSKADLTSGYIIINPQMTQFIQNYYSTTTDVQNILQHFYETIVSKFIKDKIVANEVSSVTKKYHLYAIISNELIMCFAYSIKHSLLTIRHYARQTFQQHLMEVTN